MADSPGARAERRTGLSDQAHAVGQRQPGAEAVTRAGRECVEDRDDVRPTASSVRWMPFGVPRLPEVNCTVCPAGLPESVVRALFPAKLRGHEENCLN